MRPVQGKTKVKRSKIAGLGVFATRDIRKGEVIEQMPALAIRHDDLSAIAKRNQHMFVHTHAYHPIGLREYWVGTGTLSFYNAAEDYNADTEYDWDREKSDHDWVAIVALRKIRAGEEITLDYLEEKA